MSLLKISEYVTAIFQYLLICDRYIPSNWIGKLDNLNESGHKDINNINSELVHQLKSSDGAFSLGK